MGWAEFNRHCDLLGPDHHEVIATSGQKWEFCSLFRTFLLLLLVLHRFVAVARKNAVVGGQTSAKDPARAAAAQRKDAHDPKNKCRRWH